MDSSRPCLNCCLRLAQIQELDVSSGLFFGAIEQLSPHCAPSTGHCRGGGEQWGLEAAERTGGYLRVPDAFECLAAVAAAGAPARAARLLGAAQGIRQRQQEVRFAVFDGDHAATVAALIESLGTDAYEVALAGCRSSQVAVRS